MVSLMYLALVLSLGRLVVANCTYRALKPSKIYDLRTATPFTFTNTITEVTGCLTDQIIITQWYTAFVKNEGFTAAPVTLTIGNENVTTQEFTFTRLTLTSLTPGQEITVSKSNSFSSAKSKKTSTGYFTISVATVALTLPTETASSPLPTTETRVDEGSVSRSVAIGGTVGGFLGGIGLIGGIAALSWYIRLRRQRRMRLPSDEGRLVRSW